MDTLVSVNKKIKKESFPVTGMTCAACASSVESILTNTEGVSQASVNFASNSVLIEYDDAIKETDIQNSLRSVGYDLIINVEDPIEAQAELQREHYQDVTPCILRSSNRDHYFYLLRQIDGRKSEV